MKEPIKLLPIGGLDEIGMNCMLLIYKKKALMIDCGIGFPGNDDFLEDDFFIPDFDIIDSLDVTLEGVVITHGHEDHIGAVPYLLKKFDIPVYMTEFPAMLLEERIAKISDYKTNVVPLPASRKAAFDIGPFNVKMIDVFHSIPEAKGLIIRVGGYTLVHTGDFKGDGTDKSAFFDKVPENVDVLMIDSTNIEKQKPSKTEKEIIGNIDTIIKNATGRVIATAFSSNIERISNIIKVSLKNGRKVGLIGRSINQYMAIAQRLGYIKPSDKVLTDRSKITKIPDHDITLIVTGSQAEPRSVMKRISLDMLKSVTVKYGDTIFFSSKMIPGNELAIGKMIDSLVGKGAEVFYENISEIHVSGHASRPEIVQAVKDVNPRLVVPVHGHLRFLKYNEMTAEENGFQAQMIGNGDLFSYSKSDYHLAQKIDVDKKIVSNYDSELIDFEIARERRRLSKYGFVVIMMTVDFLNNSLLVPPKILYSGIVAHTNMKKIERNLKDIISSYFEELRPMDPDWEDVEEEIRLRTRRYLFKITGKNIRFIQLL